MAQIVLITGGSRSGKSAYAQQLAENQPAPRLYVATCPVLDDDMRERVRMHRAARDRTKWETIEETVEIARIIQTRNDARVILVDCLTLWVNNLIFAADQQHHPFAEEDVTRLVQELARVARQSPATVMFVTNEVGMGIIPANAAARLFRDLAGRCNQTLAAVADSVTLVACGIPLELKSL